MRLDHLEITAAAVRIELVALFVKWRRLCWFCEITGVRDMTTNAAGWLAPSWSRNMAACANISDPVLIRFHDALTKTYGDRLERVVLFGSRARGDARADSDYDVAVFLRDLHDRFQELDRLGLAEAVGWASAHNGSARRLQEVG